MRSATHFISNMYGAAVSDAGPEGAPETDTETVPDFVYDFVAHGVPWAAALALGRRIVKVCRELDAKLITSEAAEEAIDRLAGSVFMALEAQRKARTA